jgi:NADPH:quinone reductase-like Zn-dependent oxidoreductase
VLSLSYWLTDRYRKPEFLTWEEASSIPLAAVTAYQALRSDPKIPLSKGQSVFINGGSGGVGLSAIQIARHFVGETGKVVTSCSTRNLELVKQYGADEAIDYTSVNLPAYLSEKFSESRFDLVLDAVGSFDLYHATPRFLKPTGEVIFIGSDIPKSMGGWFSMTWNYVTAMFLPSFLGGTPRKFKLCLVKTSKEKLEGVGSLVQSKEVKPVIDSTWKFDDDGIKGAYKKIMTCRARGKVVIKVVE